MKKKVALLCRVSTEQQDYNRQIDDLTKYCESKNYEVACVIASKISGAKNKNERPDLIELMQRARNHEFEKVIVTEVSRLARKAKALRKLIDELHELGISVVFQTLGGLESLDDQGKESFVVNIIIEIHSQWAEEEHRNLKIRIRSGMERARKTKHIGRPFGTTEDNTRLLKKYSKLSKDLESGLSLSKCMKLHEVSRNTVIKIKRLLAA